MFFAGTLLALTSVPEADMPLNVDEFSGGIKELAERSAALEAFAR